MSPSCRFFTLAAGLMGAAGVGLAAAATHAGAPELLNPASNMLLFHAAALLALALGGSSPIMLLAGGGTLFLGTVLFSGDLALRALAGIRAFPMAAPAGGVLMIAGWLITGLCGLFGRRRTA